jgi:hypothetical protein
VKVIQASPMMTAAWFNKRPGEMSMKELKLAISNAGLRADTDGFVEKSEFIALLESYLTDINGQDECPVCLEVLNLSVKTIRLPCHHLMCESCLCSIVSRENLSCTCPLCRESVSETALAIGMKNAGYTAAVLLGGYQGNNGDEIFDRAEAQFREALRKEPHNVGFLTTLADMVLDKGETREAELLCRRAIYFDPQDPIGFATLARVYKETDKSEQALDCYKKSLALREIPDVRSNMVTGLHFF